MGLLIPGSWVRAPHRALIFFPTSPSFFSAFSNFFSAVKRASLPYLSSTAASLCSASSKISGMAVTISLCISTGATPITSSSFLHRSCEIHTTTHLSQSHHTKKPAPTTTEANRCGGWADLAIDDMIQPSQLAKNESWHLAQLPRTQRTVGEQWWNSEEII